MQLPQFKHVQSDKGKLNFDREQEVRCYIPSALENESNLVMNEIVITFYDGER